MEFDFVESKHLRRGKQRENISGKEEKNNKKKEK